MINDKFHKGINVNQGVWYTGSLFNRASPKRYYFYFASSRSHKCLSTTVIAILYLSLCFSLIVHARNYLYRRKYTYIYFTKWLALETKRVEYILPDIVRHLVSFVPDNPRTYFSAISLITSRHGSFICIIRTNIRPAGIRAVNERIIARSYRMSNLIFVIVSAKRESISLSLSLWLVTIALRTDQ